MNSVQVLIAGAASTLIPIVLQGCGGESGASGVDEGTIELTCKADDGKEIKVVGKQNGQVENAEECFYDLILHSDSKAWKLSPKTGNKEIEKLKVNKELWIQMGGKDMTIKDLSADKLVVATNGGKLTVKDGKVQDGKPDDIILVGATEFGRTGNFQPEKPKTLELEAAKKDDKVKKFTTDYPSAKGKKSQEGKIGAGF